MTDNNNYGKSAVLLDRKGAVAHLKLNRPATMNSVNGDLCLGLVRSIPAVRISIRPKSKMCWLKWSKSPRPP